MTKLTNSIFNQSKNLRQKGAQLNINRHYKTVIFNNKGKFQSTHDIYKYNFPKDMGFLMHLTHDKEETETQEAYLERCYKQIMDIINTYGKDNFVFFAYSTVFYSRTGKPIDMQSVEDLTKKFLKGENITLSDLAVIAGHLALYTKEGKYLSHSPQYDQSKLLQASQEEVIRHDVAKSIAEKQQVATYIAVLNKACLPKISFEQIINIIKKYGWAAKGELGQKSGEEDNCATAVQKFCMGVKIRGRMNPVETLSNIIQFAINKIDLTREEHNAIMTNMLKSGLLRDLFNISKDEESYKNSFSDINSEINTPTKKQ